jgi:flagellar biosynthetic protein FliR
MSLLVLTFTLVLVRVGAFVAAFPVLGARTVPRLVKVGLTMVLTLAWLGDVSPASLRSDVLSQQAQVTALGLGLAVGRELLLGASLGYVLGLMLVPARVAGEYLAQETGLSLGNQLDPTGANPSSAITQILEFLAILLFLGLDGHHVILAMLHRTFVLQPLGGPLLNLSMEQLVEGVSHTEEAGLVLAAPLGIYLFLTTVVLVFMTKAAPQLNLYSIGFPLRLFVGLLALLILVPAIIAEMANQLVDFTALLRIFG